MKRIIRFFLILLLLGSMLLPVLAAGTDLTMNSVTAVAGEPVYLTVTLNKETLGDTMGIEYTYNTQHLDAVPELCSWSKTASLKDFGLQDRGVWAAKSADTLSGSICTLAFRIKSGADFSETTVKCTLVVKNGTKQTGSYQAEATVTMGCAHTYTAWDGSQKTVHSRSCQQCGLNQTEPHSWDSGVIQKDPQNSSKKIRLFTCSVCGATRSETVATDESISQIPSPTVPTEPEPTRPESTAPEESRPQPTEPTYETKPSPTEPPAPTQPAPIQPAPTQPAPTKPQSSTPPTPTQPQTGHEGHDHTQSTIPVATQPPFSDTSGQHSADDGHDHGTEIIYDDHGNILAIYNPTEGSQEETHSEHDGHDHTEDVVLTDTKPNTSTAIIVAVFVVVCVGAAVFFLKKKKR